MKTLFSLMTAAALFATTAMAGDDMSGKDSQRTSEQKFKSLDRNEDSQISKSEAQNDETLSVQFASLDQDSDGYVSKSEYTAMADAQQPGNGKQQPDYSE